MAVCERRAISVREVVQLKAVDLELHDVAGEIYSINPALAGVSRVWFT